MKKILLALSFLATVSAPLMAQTPCSELFISEYLEGTNNNKALEVYNPTSQTISLDGYGICRNNNGNAAWLRTKFPAGATIAPFKTYVVVLDKRDLAQVRNSLEYPTFDGYQVWDTCRVNGVVQRDQVTGAPVFCIQFDSVAASTFLPRRGTVYNDFLDLKCRANGFLNPVYNTNATFYHNGNDAVGLFKGTDLDTVLMSNLLDMVGVFNDPGMVSGAGWKDWLGRDLTKDRTLVRKRDVRQGTGLVAFARADTFRYSDWLVYTHSSYQTPFQYLGSHTCDCDANTPAYGRRTCQGNLVGTKELAAAEFKIFPNPAVSGNISIEADGNIADIRVFDMMGRVIETQKMLIQTENVQLTLESVTTGVYFVQVNMTDGRVGTRKLVIK